MRLLHATARAILALLLIAPGAACRHFPVGLFAGDAVFEELERTRFDHSVTPARAAAQMSAYFDFQGEPRPLRPRAYHRLDLGIRTISADELDAAGSAMTAGLRSGDLVLATNGKAQGLAQTLAMEDFVYYDHMGVLVVDGDVVHVYESWPRFVIFAKGGDFASRFQGRVQRTRLGSFMRRYEVLEVVRFDDPGLADRVADAARASLAEDIRFDPYHDPESPELSCTEYVEYLFERAGRPLGLVPGPVTSNPSISRARRALGFDRSAYLTPDAFARAPGATHAAWISRHATPAENLAVREAYVWLHGSVDARSTLGDYIEVDRFRLLDFRPSTVAFLEWAKGYFHAKPTTDRATMRRVLARMGPIFFVPRGGA